MGGFLWVWCGWVCICRVPPPRPSTTYANNDHTNKPPPPSPKPQMTRKQMYSHLVTMLAAGHDTTAFCTCYTLFLLAKNPDVRTCVPVCML